MIKENLKNIRGRKTGIEYITLKIPKKLFERIPDLFYIDLEIKTVRDGNPKDKAKDKE